MEAHRTPGFAARWLVQALIAMGLLPGLAAARCLPFKLPDQIAKVPFVVLGKVSQSNQASLVAGACELEACTHRFHVEVVEVLKGRTTPRSLQFQYPYLHQREEIALFAEGQAFIFAISQIRPDGQATLYGTNCGRTGLPDSELERVRQSLKKPPARAAAS